MRDVTFYLLETDRFRVYYDEKAYDMGRYSLVAAKEAYPYLSLLLGVRIKDDSFPLLPSQQDRTIISRFDKITYILGDRFEGPGFANPATLNIEAQMIQGRPKSFYQHEMVHRLMYEHNDPSLGSLGRLFSLAMMPTWWLEGLAEYYTESSGEAETNGIERSMALTDYWPSWDRMHALYNANGDTNLRGYVASGRFLSSIFAKAKEKDDSVIQEQIGDETFIPPFYNAADSWLKKNVGAYGVELYQQYQQERKEYWEDYLQKMPPLDLAQVNENILSEEYYYSVFVAADKAFIAKVPPFNVAAPHFLEYKDFDSSVERRLPVTKLKSPIFAVDQPKDGIYLTTQIKKFSNGAFGTDLVLFSFKGELTQATDETFVKEKTILFATIENPYVINQIQNAGNSTFFIAANIRGNTVIYFVDTKNSEVKLLEQYPSPLNVSFLQNLSADNINQTNKCVNYILNSDDNLTSVQKTCIDGTQSEILPAKTLIARDGYIQRDGSLRLLVNWGKILSIVDVHFSGKETHIEPLAAFPEWVTGIFPWNYDKETDLGLWVYKKGKYHFTKINLHKLKDNFTAWQKNQAENSIFKNFPQFTPYEPPFKSIYNKRKQALLGVDLEQYEKNIAQLNSLDDAENDFEFTKSKKENDNINSYTPVAAPYRTVFMFAYPYWMPDFLGGPSVGLFAVPFVDKMERYRIQIFGGYNFFLESPSGAITYINNRFLDVFNISVFSSPFFNGYYDLLQSSSSGLVNIRYYNYLRQTGQSITGAWQFRPTTFVLQSTLTLSSLTPYTTLPQAPQSVGAQSANLISLTGLLSFNLLNTSFYMAQKENTHGNWLSLKTNMAIGGGKFYSLGMTKDAAGNDSGTLDYYNANASTSTVVNFYGQNLSFTGFVSTTQGPGTLNIKEIYAPFVNYIIGETKSLNYVSYPIYGSGALFQLLGGNWSYALNANYDFPLYPSFGKKFLMTFLENWRGILGISRGGVSDQSLFKGGTLETSVSAGTSITIDIKGYQLYPALLYSQLLEESGWYILLQMKFMNFM